MKVLIAGKEVPVLLKSGRALKNEYGLFCTEKEHIELREKMDVNLRRKTLAHECFHAFLFLTGYNELLLDISPNAEEALARAFEQSLGDLMVFNQELEDWIEG